MSIPEPPTSSRADNKSPPPPPPPTKNTPPGKNPALPHDDEDASPPPPPPQDGASPPAPPSASPPAPPQNQAAPPSGAFIRPPTPNQPQPQPQPKLEVTEPANSLLRRHSSGMLTKDPMNASGTAHPTTAGGPGAASLLAIPNITTTSASSNNNTNNLAVENTSFARNPVSNNNNIGNANTLKGNSPGGINNNNNANINNSNAGVRTTPINLQQQLSMPGESPNNTVSGNQQLPPPQSPATTQQQQQQPQTPQQMPPASIAAPPQQQRSLNGASEMVELALRAEVKRLREENLELRRAADRARALETEAAMLRDASVWQLDEKAPIKLRQLELDNHRLRRKCQGMEERLAMLEMERKALAALGGSGGGGAQSGSGASPGGYQGGSPGGDQHSPGSGNRRSSPKSSRRDPLANLGGGADGSGASVIAANAANFVCTNCKLKISVNNRAWQQRMDEVRKENTELKDRLDSATNELNQISQWVTHVVNIHNQYPSLAQTTGASHVASLLGGANEHLKVPRK